MLKKVNICATVIILGMGIHGLYGDVTNYYNGSNLPYSTIYPEGDRLLAQRIREKIMNDNSLSDNAHHINVSVVGGTVTLRGIVDSDDERNRIDSMVRLTNGVNNVDNRLALPITF